MAKLNATTAARHCGKSERTIRTWISAGKLPAVKVDGEWEINPHDLARVAGNPVKHPPVILPEVPPEVIATLEARIEALENELSTLRLRMRGVEVLSRPASLPVVVAPPPVVRELYQPKPMPVVVQRVRYGTGSPFLPTGMMSRTDVADLHNFPRSTLRRWCDERRIETSSETYGGDHGQFAIAHPVTMRGLAEFYALASRRTDFQLCPNCPHDMTALPEDAGDRARGDTMPLTEHLAGVAGDIHGDD